MKWGKECTEWSSTWIKPIKLKETAHKMCTFHAYYTGKKVPSCFFPSRTFKHERIISGNILSIT